MFSEELYEALSMVTDVSGLFKERIPEISQKIDVNRYLKTVLKSEYDYRAYFKSGR